MKFRVITTSGDKKAVRPPSQEVELPTLEDFMNWVDVIGEEVIVRHPSRYGLPAEKQPLITLEIYDDRRE